MTDTSVPKTAEYACLYCGEVIPLETRQLFPSCPRCQHKNGWKPTTLVSKMKNFYAPANCLVR